jgi:hypothetical protein
MMIDTDVDTLDIGEETTFDSDLSIKRITENKVTITLDGEESTITDKQFKKLANAMGYITREKSDIDAW